MCICFLSHTHTHACVNLCVCIYLHIQVHFNMLIKCSIAMMLLFINIINIDWYYFFFLFWIFIVLKFCDRFLLFFMNTLTCLWSSPIFYPMHQQQLQSIEPISCVATIKYLLWSWEGLLKRYILTDDLLHLNFFAGKDFILVFWFQRAIALHADHGHGLDRSDPEQCKRERRERDFDEKELDRKSAFREDSIAGHFNQGGEGSVLVLHDSYFYWIKN